MTGAIHFLHIRKTGGTAVKAALSPIATEYNIVLHNHGTTLADIPKGERVVFAVRDPVARFVSGFNSRLRKGRPLFHFEWTEGEATSFARFRTPNALAEALSSEDEDTHAAALLAMREIRHVNAPLSTTLESPGYVAARLASTVWIAFTETLASDFEEIKTRLHLPAALALPKDDLRAHRTPPGISADLSELGWRNIDAWYANDRAFVAYLREARESLAGAMD